jgi:predicted ArsR family transcriptional regulator
MLRQQLLDSSRGRIVALLRGRGQTADDIARELGLTPSAVRAHISAMERDGVVQRVGTRRGTTRPFQVFELTPEIEQLLSTAYLPLLTELVQVFAEALPAEQVESLLRAAGQRLAQTLSQGRRVPRGLESRMAVASEILNEHLGATTRVESNGEIVIRGAGCPLAALTGKHPGVCLAMESFVSAIVGVPVHECCDRERRPECCFVVRRRDARVL